MLDEMKSDAKALNAAVENYVQAMKDKGKISSDINVDDYLVDDNSSNQSQSTPQASDNQQSSENAENGKITGKVESVKTSVNDGNTYYYLEINGKYYYIAAKDCMDVLLISAGDTVTVTAGEESNGVFVAATDVQR